MQAITPDVLVEALTSKSLTDLKYKISLKKNSSQPLLNLKESLDFTELSLETTEKVVDISDASEELLFKLQNGEYYLISNEVGHVYLLRHNMVYLQM